MGWGNGLQKHEGDKQMAIAFARSVFINTHIKKNIPMEKLAGQQILTSIK
jgi:hypothetical protein